MTGRTGAQVRAKEKAPRTAGAATPVTTQGGQPDANPALPAEGRARAVIEGITPQVDHGRFAVKRIAWDRVEVEADCFADGHDVLACVLRHRKEDETAWN
ncbi:MAG: maltotransferase domain-containing protein, partial [Casimicrobiaceae bacterium]